MRLGNELRIHAATCLHGPMTIDYSAADDGKAVQAAGTAELHID